MTALALGAFVWTLGNHQGAAADSAGNRPLGFGSRECPLDISVLWTADVDSPVYSTPVILPSPIDGRNQIVLATLRSAIELLEGDGSTAYPWPVEIDDALFLASPALHDIDGDGSQDVCIANTGGAIRWLSTGDAGPHLWAYGQRVQPLRVERSMEIVGDRAAGFVSVGAGGPGAGRKDPRSGGRRLLLDASEPPPRRVPEGENGPTGTDSAADTEGDGADVGAEGQLAAEDVEEAVFDPDRIAAYAEDVYDWGDYAGPNDDDIYFGGAYWGGYGDDYGWENAGRLSGHSPSGTEGKDFVEVDAHILAAPVFADVTGNGGVGMIVPVSYFFDRSRHADPLVNMDGFSPEEFVAGSLKCWDFRHDTWLWTYDLGQTMNEADTGAYVYAPPTVGDLDGDGSLEVVVGTAKGELHVLDARTGLAREGFPVTYDAMKGQVAIADVDGDQELEILLGDSSGVVACVKHDGRECWNRRLSGSIKSMVTLGDVDGDGTLDVVVGVTTEEGEGEVWALSAESGLPLPNFPVKLENRKGISTAITLVDLHQRTAGDMGGAAASDTYGQAKRNGGVVPIGGWGMGLHLLAPSEDGHVYVIEGATGCVNKIDLGERVLSMVLADDLEGDGTLDLLVGTMSGEVVVLSANVPFHPLNAWTSSSRGQVNSFVHGGYQGVFFAGGPSALGDVVGREFAVAFEIVDRSLWMEKRERDGQEGGGKPYQISISAGGQEVFRRAYAHPGVHVAMVSLQAPTRVLLRIEMTTAQRLVFEDHVFVAYNTEFHAALKWMVVAPVVLAALPFLWVRRGVGTALPV